MRNQSLSVIQQKSTTSITTTLGLQQITMLSKSVLFVAMILVNVAISPNAKADGQSINAYRAIKPKTIDERIIRKLEKLRLTMPVGNPDRGIPILDPYDIGSRNFNIDTILLWLNMTIENVIITGLKDFQINDITIHILPAQVDFNFTLPKLKIEGNRYNLKGRMLHFVPIFGKGDFVLVTLIYSQLSYSVYFVCDLFYASNWIKVEQANIGGFARVTLREKYIRVVNISLDGKFENFEFSISGLMKNRLVSKVFSKIISNIIPIVYQEFKDNIWRRLEEDGLLIVNRLIQNVTIQQALKVLEDEDDGFLPLDFENSVMDE